MGSGHLDAEYLVGELGEKRALVGERRAPGGRRAVEADHPPVAGGAPRAEQPCRLHTVQRRVQGARTDGIAMIGELGGHPRAVQLAFARVVQHVEANRTAQEVAHAAIVIRLKVPARDHCGGAPGLTGSLSERGTAAHLETAGLPPLVPREWLCDGGLVVMDDFARGGSDRRPSRGASIGPVSVG